jgi:malonate transporter MadL subunit
MVIYGVALLSFCMLVGIFIGDLIGDLIGAQANVGGVGIAMLLLIFLSNLSKKEFHLSTPTESGVNFWSAMYIPIVVAMAARQNVVAAVSSGWMAIIAGALAVAVSFAMIPLLDKLHIAEGHRDDS